MPDRDRVAGITALEAKLAAAGTTDPAAGFLYRGRRVPRPAAASDAAPTAALPRCRSSSTSWRRWASSCRRRGVPVVVDTGTPEVDSNAVVVQGTFLVGRTGAGDGWRVVARYVPGRSSGSSPRDRGRHEDAMGRVLPAAQWLVAACTSTPQPTASPATPPPPTEVPDATSTCPGLVVDAQASLGPEFDEESFTRDESAEIAGAFVAGLVRACTQAIRTPTRAPSSRRQA